MESSYLLIIILVIVVLIAVLVFYLVSNNGADVISGTGNTPVDNTNPDKTTGNTDNNGGSTGNETPDPNTDPNTEPPVVIEPPIVSEPSDDGDTDVTDPIKDDDNVTDPNEEGGGTPDPETPDDNVDDEVTPGDKKPYKTSRFDDSKPITVPRGKELREFLDFVMPESGFPTGKPKYPFKFYKDPKGIPLKICEAKWNDRGVNTSTAWKNNYETYSGGRFKWTNVEMKVLKMGVDASKGNRGAVQSKCGPPGSGIRILAYHIPSPTVGGGGSAHISGRFTFGVDHESGHAIGLPHSAGLYKYPDSHPVLSTHYTKYNSINNYGSPNCTMGNRFPGEPPGFCAPAIFKLGWQPDGFKFIENGQTYKIRNQMNFASDLPVALCFRNFYTGTLMMIEYAGKDNKGFFKNSEFSHTDHKKYTSKTGFILSGFTGRPIALDFYGTKHFETPFGWIFDVVGITNDDATLKVSYDPTKITYKNARISLKTIGTGKGKLRVCMRLYDITTGDDINNPPRTYNPSFMVLQDAQGKNYNLLKQVEKGDLAPYGLVHDQQDIPIFASRNKDRNGDPKAKQYTGFGIKESEVKLGDWTNYGCSKLYFDVEHPQKTGGTAQFKFILHKDYHCMVKILDLEFPDK